MEDIEKKLSELIDKKLSEAQNDSSIQKEIMQEFDNKLKRAKSIFWIYMVISALIMVGAISNVFNPAVESKDLIIAAGAFGTGLGLNILIKLWYPIVYSRIQIQKDIKEVKFMLSEKLRD